RWVVCAHERAGAPQASLLQIAAGPAHNSDNPIDIYSEFEEFIGGDTKEETKAE
ncbi:hypothetical protein KI387_012739, partial [Taxus chinensis]